MVHSRSRTLLSPLRSKPDSDSLAARYDSLTKSSSSTASMPVDDDDSDFEEPSYKPHSNDEFSPPRNQRNIPIPSLPSKPAPSEDVEEVENPILAALAAKARASAAKEAEDTASAARSTAPTAIVQLLITSEIPETVPLFVKIKTDATIDKPRVAWCGRQKCLNARTQDIFLTWKNNKLFDTTTIARLGVRVDPNGYITVDGDSEIYDEHSVPKIHLKAWTEELFKQRKKEDEEEAAAKRKANEPPPIEEEEVPEPVKETPKIRLILKGRGKADFKIVVKPVCWLNLILRMDNG